MRGRAGPPSLALLALGTLGCATAHNLTPVALEAPPTVQTEWTKELEPHRRRTFSVFPLSMANPAAALKGPGPETAMLFALRNALEARGFAFVPVAESPDLLATLDVSFSVTRTFDRKRPPTASLSAGRILPAPEALAPLLSPAARSVLQSAGWGGLPEAEPGTSLFPGYPPAPGTRRTRAPRGRYVATVSVALVDPATLSQVWTGVGVGVSRTPDTRLSAQSVLWTVLDQLPTAPVAELVTQTLPGEVPGLELAVATNDGLGFFPSVLGVEPGSPGWKAGLKAYDMILAVGGDPMRNRTLRDARARLPGPAGSGLALTVWRRGEQFHAIVTRQPAAPSSAGGVAAPSPEPRWYVPPTVPDPTRLLPAVMGTSALAVLLAAGLFVNL